MTDHAHTVRSIAAEKLGLRGTRWGGVALVVGALALVAAVALGTQQNDQFARFQHSWLVATMFVTSLSVGALFFVIIQHLTRAGWSVVVRRIAELIAANVGASALFIAPLVVWAALGHGTLWSWADPAAAATDAVLAKKAVFLEGRFFALRAIVYFGAWWGISRWLLARSTEQDGRSDAEPTLALERRAAPAMVAFAITVSLAAFDLLMSIEPKWSSTIFGVYFFAGSVLSFFAVAILALRFLQARGFFAKSVNVEHYHDLGKFLFAFTFFWGYIAFSQFMLIWYADQPEETIWFHERFAGSWRFVSATLLVGHFILPFAGLLSRHAKRRLVVLTCWAAWMLVMHATDLFWLVMPSLQKDGALLQPIDVAAFVAVLGLWLFALTRLARDRSLIPTGDPRLPESLAFENL